MNFTVPILTALLLLTGCLKTRTQLRDSDDGSPIVNRPAQPDPKGSYALDEVKSELTLLSGRIEDLERKERSSKDDAPTKDELEKLQSRIEELEQAQLNMLESIKRMQNEPSSAPVSQEEIFKKGKADFNAGRYETAILEFSSYLKGSKPKNIEEATFLRGESHFNSKQFKKAIVDFSTFPDKFSSSRFMPKALLRIGMSFEALGMKDDSSAFFQELTDKYPKSAEAKTARGFHSSNKSKKK